MHVAVKITAALCALLLLALGGWVLLMSNAGCATVSVETLEAYAALQPATMPTADAEPLNETRIEAEMPALARLLDEALANGRASEDHERTARAMHLVLQREAPDHVFSWRGEPMQHSLAVC